MAETGYLNFDLEIEHAGQRYDVHVLRFTARAKPGPRSRPQPIAQIDGAGTPQAIGEHSTRPSSGMRSVAACDAAWTRRIARRRACGFVCALPTHPS